MVVRDKKIKYLTFQLTVVGELGDLGPRYVCQRIVAGLSTESDSVIIQSLEIMERNVRKIVWITNPAANPVQVIH